MSTWAQLLANFAVVAMFVSVWIHTHVWVDRLGPRTSSAAFGLLMGVGVVALMNIPVELLPGVNGRPALYHDRIVGIVRWPRRRPRSPASWPAASVSTKVAWAPMPARFRSAPQ